MNIVVTPTRLMIDIHLDEDTKNFLTKLVIEASKITEIQNAIDAAKKDKAAVHSYAYYIVEEISKILKKGKR